MEPTLGNKFSVQSSEFRVQKAENKPKEGRSSKVEGRELDKSQRSSSLVPRPSRSGYVVAVNISENKGERKKNIEECLLLEEHGLERDAHAGDWHRQVSLLAEESIEKMREMGLDVSSGDFAENITTKGINLVSLPVGTKLKTGDTLLEVTQIGKVCHDRCAIYYQAGDCVMPREGIFCRVLKGGPIKVGDQVKIAKS